ncbi:MAG: ArsR/SmtB family transcription factor [Candidatus Hodarchaeota archaeon]
MVSLTRLALIFSALGSEKRLKLLKNIENGIANPGEITRKMKLPRSTIEKHIRVLLRAGLLEKQPSLSPEGQLRVYYTINNVTNHLIEIVKRNLEEE